MIEILTGIAQGLVYVVVVQLTPIAAVVWVSR